MRGFDRESFSEFLDLLFRRFDSRERICSVAGNNNAADSIRSIDIEDAATSGGTELHCADVADGDGDVIANGNDVPFEVFDVFDIACAAEEILDAIDGKISGTDFLIRFTNGIGDLR